MGRKSQEKMTEKTYEQRKANAGNMFSRAVRALKKVNRERVRGKPHPYKIANSSRDGIPRGNETMPIISLHEKPTEGTENGK